MREHTPGPWFLFGTGVCVGGPFSGPDASPGQNTAGIAHCGMRMRPLEEAVANARLIAAAPDMLGALRHFITGMEAGADNQVYLANALKSARAAVSKALGTGEIEGT